MRNSSIVKLDEKGRMLIPAQTRKFLNAGSGTELVIVEDKDRQQVRLLPLARDKTAELRFIIPDLTGSVARIAAMLDEFNANIIMSESRTLVKGRTAEWDVIIDTSKCSKSLEDFKKKAMCAGMVKNIEILKNYA